MDSLLKRIIKEITRPYHKLSVITNPDGFLCREDTINAFATQANISILCLSQLELRIWFETTFRNSENQTFVVILEDTRTVSGSGYFFVLYPHPAEKTRYNGLVPDPACNRNRKPGFIKFSESQISAFFFVYTIRR